MRGGHLIVFLTRGVTLADWRRIGMLDRELAIYRRLIESGWRVTLMSFGAGAQEAEVAKAIKPIGVCFNDRGQSAWRYRRGWLRQHGEMLRTGDVIKTNQTDGGDAARRAARQLKKPLVARCGYMLSEFRGRRFGARDRRTRAARRLEDRLFTAAARVQVTTEAMAADVARPGIRPGVQPTAAGGAQLCRNPAVLPPDRITRGRR